ncbi:MAG: NfeD family protein [bacterium]|nr:NfeD family protein [bacterium]
MELWLVWVIAGIVFFIIELFTPVLFFLNLAIAAFFGAIAAYFGLAAIWQVLIFGAIAGILLGFLRPLLVKNVKKDDTTSGLEEKYIGKAAKTIRPTGAIDGRITIYGEEWGAKSIDGNEIPEGTDVKIIRNEDMIFIVEKI